MEHHLKLVFAFGLGAKVEQRRRMARDALLRRIVRVDPAIRPQPDATISETQRNTIAGCMPWMVAGAAGHLLIARQDRIKKQEPPQFHPFHIGLWKGRKLGHQRRGRASCIRGKRQRQKRQQEPAPPVLSGLPSAAFRFPAPSPHLNVPVHDVLKQFLPSRSGFGSEVLGQNTRLDGIERLIARQHVLRLRPVPSSIALSQRP
jgi:hypothetical protein